MKYRYLLLIIGLNSLIFGADDYTVPQIVHVLIEGVELEIPGSIFNKISLLYHSLAFQGGTGPLSIEASGFKINATQLQNLIELLQGASLDDLTFLELVDILVLADYLQVQDQAFLDSLTNKIKHLVNIDDLNIELIPDIESININLKLLNELLQLDHVGQINWQPQGNFYFVRYQNGTGQLYNLAGDKIGNVLRDVYSVSWRPQGDLYFVQMRGIRGGFFDITGNLVGPIKENTLSIEWSPKGDQYFISNQWHVGSIHKHTGELIRGDLHGALSIFWNDTQTRYLIKFIQQGGQSGDLWRLYNADGTQIRQMLPDHFAKTVYWQPQGNQFFMNIDNSNLALFDQDGNQIDSVRHANVEDVYWRPDGQVYFILYKNRTGRFFDSTHNYFGDKFKHVSYFSWMADGHSYFIQHTDGTGQLYDKADSLSFVELNDVQAIYFQPHGKKLFITLSNQSAILYEYYQFKNISLYGQLLVQAILNRSEELKDALANTTTSDSSMVEITPHIEHSLPKEVIDLLQKSLYLTSEARHRSNSGYYKGDDEEEELENFSGKRQNPCSSCVIS